MKSLAAVLAQTAETIKGAVDIVDKASVAGDRWLFIAALGILLGFAGIVIKWLVASIEKKDEAHAAERKIMDAEIKAERTESRAQRKEDQAAFLLELGKIGSGVATVGVELRALTEAQNKNTTILTNHDKDMRDAHRLELRAAVHEELAKLGIASNPSRPA